MKPPPPIVIPRISRRKILKSMGFAPFLLPFRTLFGPQFCSPRQRIRRISRQPFHSQTIACSRIIRFNLLWRTFSNWWRQDPINIVTEKYAFEIESALNAMERNS